MGLFGKKEVKVRRCDICGNELQKKAYRAKDGAVCNECYTKAGYRPFDLVNNSDMAYFKFNSILDLKEQVGAGTRFVNTALIVPYIDGLPGIVPPAFCKFTLDKEELVITAAFTLQHMSGADVILQSYTFGISQKDDKIQEKTFRIPYSRILSVDVLTTENITAKNKNVVGRGIIGGLLFGGAGMLLGGMSGVGVKQVVNRESLFAVAYTDKNNEIANISCKAGNDIAYYYMFVDYFNTNFNQNIFSAEEEKNKDGDVLL